MRSDVVSFVRILSLLPPSYQGGITLSGLLFFHRISDNRMGGSPLRLLETFKNLCGSQALPNVILVTTMWDDVTDVDGSKRESELCERYWKPMIVAGSRTARFLNTCNSGWNIISSIEPQSRLPVLLQTELVDLGKDLRETSAGRSLFQLLYDTIEDVIRVLKSIRDRLKTESQKESRAALMRRIVENERKLETINIVAQHYAPPGLNQHSSSYSDFIIVSRSTSPTPLPG